MRTTALLLQLAALSMFPVLAQAAPAQEQPYGRGLTEANQERLVIDDMEDISAWSTGTPIETTLSASDQHVKQGRNALKFGNVVDHTRGEKDYPIGWPRTSRSLAKAKLTDWSGYDYFQCWIYVDTNREALPGSPLGIGFNHTGHRRTSSFTLREVRKGQWVKVVIPIAKLIDPKDVQSVQFHIAESSYKHLDRVDFYIDDMVLTRYTDPTIAELLTDRRILYHNDRQIAALYTLMGHRDMEHVRAEFEIGQGATAVAKTEAHPDRQGELPLAIAHPLTPGDYWARLSLRDAQGWLIDRRQAEFRVIAGPRE
jgi:hypothetical protein